jgi:hypothetical protein
MVLGSGQRRSQWGVASPSFGRSVRTAARAYSREPGMPSVRALVAVAFVFTCASCAQQSDGPSASPASKTSAPPPTSPTPSVPPELTRYTDAERAAYAAAVQAYSEFTQQNSQLLSQGRTTEPASTFYQRYSIDWVEAWANLAKLANNHVTVSGPTRINWVRPKSITLEPSGSAVVVLRRCLDESGLKVMQAGKPLAQPQLAHPHVYQVRLAKNSVEGWWRSGSARQGARC